MLRCTHPGCGHPFDVSASLISYQCSKCLRFLLRCPNADCQAINRPFARFCTLCARPIPPTYTQCMGDDSLTRLGERTRIELKREKVGVHRPHVVRWDFNLESYLTSDWPKGLVFAVAASGCLVWIGLPGGQYLIVDSSEKPRVILHRALDTDSTEMPVRAIVHGGWLVAFTNRRIVVEDLRAVELEAAVTVSPALMYGPLSAGTIVATRPLIVPIAGDPKGRMEVARMAWLEREADGRLSFVQTVFGLTAALPPEKTAVSLPHGATGAGAAALVLLCEAPLLFAVIDTAGVALIHHKDSRFHSKEVRLPDNWACGESQHGLACAAVLPDAPNGPTFGQIAIALRTANGSYDLGLLSISKSNPYEPLWQVEPGGGYPVSVTADGQRLVVVREQRVGMLNRLRQYQAFANDPSIQQIQAVDVFGRLALLTGKDSSPKTWYCMLVDLNHDRVIDRITHRGVLSTIIGRRWLTVEMRVEDNEKSFWLVSRWLDAE